MIPTPAGRRTVRIGSGAWYHWLATATHFYIQHPLGNFGCRKQRAQRGNPYWVAYRRVNGVVYRAYVGGETTLQRATLEAVAQELAHKVATTASAAPSTPRGE